MLRRLRGLHWLVAIVLVVAFAAIGVGCTDKKTAPKAAPQAENVASGGATAAGANGNAIQFPKPQAPPDPKTIPTSYAPKPGDLLFYTNGSVSYNSQAKHPWVVIIDAKTKKIVAANEIPEMDSSPHGIGVAEDGTKLYIPAGIAASIPGFGSVPGGAVKFGNGVTVVDAKTLKTLKNIPTLDAPHHIQVLDDRTMMVDEWGVKQVMATVDVASDKITHEIAADAFGKGARPYIGFASPDGQYIYETVRPAVDAGTTEAWIARIKLSDWSTEKVVDIGGGLVWTTFSRDGRWAYVTVPDEDMLAKVDLQAKKVVARAATGRGPYGVTLSPDEKTAYVVSKGEGGRGQRGGTYVMIDVESMRTLKEVPSCLAFVCQADHAVISPDGAEYWIDNNMGYLDVFDAKSGDLKAEVTMPLLADPHGGTFVQYDQAGKGHVVMDLGGPHGGVSPYAFDNQNGVPTLAQALSKGGWDAAKSSAAYVLGARPQPAPTPPPGSQAVTIDLRMIDFAYQPSALTIPAKALVTVRLINDGQAVHNVQSDALGIQLHDVNVNSRDQIQFLVPDKPGVYALRCTYHPGMQMDITVK